MKFILFLQKFKNDYRFRQSPYSKKIVKDIFEIRIKVKDCYGVLYAFLYRDTVILLHIFKKKTNKISKKDLKLAVNGTVANLVFGDSPLID